MLRSLPQVSPQTNWHSAVKEEETAGSGQGLPLQGCQSHSRVWSRNTVRRPGHQICDRPEAAELPGLGKSRAAVCRGDGAAQEDGGRVRRTSQIPKGSGARRTFLPHGLRGNFHTHPGPFEVPLSRSPVRVIVRTVRVEQQSPKYMSPQNL